MRNLVILILLCLQSACTDTPHRMHAYAHAAGLRSTNEYPVYIDLRFIAKADERDRIYAWFTTNGFKHVGYARDRDKKKISDAFTYEDLLEASLAEIAGETWVVIWGILADDQMLRSRLQALVDDLKSKHKMKEEEVTLP